MRKLVIWITAVSIPAVFLGPAFAAEDYLIRVYYDGDTARLADTSFVPYAIYGDYALGEVGVGYASRLASRGFRFDVLAEDPTLKNIWDVTLPLAELPAGAEILAAVGPGHYVVTAPPGADFPPGEEARRLEPRAVDFEAIARARPPISFAPQDEVAAVVAGVNRNRYENTVRDLAAFGTRYDYSPKCKEAANYIENAFTAAGYDVQRDRYFGPKTKRVAAASADVAWAAGDAGFVVRTVDGGKRWEVLGLVADTEVYSLACASADVAWFGTRAGEIYKTADGGANWTKVELGAGIINDLFFLDGQRGWATTSRNDVFRTEDGGDSWVKVGSVDEWPRGVAFTDARNGLLCGSRGYLARTTDGGASWSRVGVAPNVKLEAVAYRSATEAYVVGEAGTVLRSTDGGAGWSAVDLDTDEFLRDVAFKGNTGIIVGAIGRAWRSSGAGDWEKLSPPKYILYAVALGSAQVLWCGASGGALPYSADGGTTWEDHASHADPTSTYVWDNVWVRQRGRGGASGTVLVCAHYDSISKGSSQENPEAPAPGADDNATGTAAVLEFARASEGHSYRRDVIYVCYSGEEVGLYGSQHFAAKLATAGEPLVAVLNADMVGYADELPEDADLITNYNGVWIPEYMRRAAATYVPNLGLDITIDPDMWRSDHASYWGFGYASILVIEDWPLVYKWYHTVNDLPEKLDFDVAALMTRGVVAAAASLASPTSMPAQSPLDAVEVYPNPYRFGVHGGRVFFANLPANSSVKFFNVAGELVAEGANGSEPVWPFELELKTRPLRASGVYLYLIESPGGEKKIGKLAVIR